MSNTHTSKLNRKRNHESSLPLERLVEILFDDAQFDEPHRARVHEAVKQVAKEFNHQEMIGR